MRFVILLSVLVICQAFGSISIYNEFPAYFIALAITLSLDIWQLSV